MRRTVRLANRVKVNSVSFIYTVECAARLCSALGGSICKQSGHCSCCCCCCCCQRRQYQRDEWRRVLPLILPSRLVAYPTSSCCCCFSPAHRKLLLLLHSSLPLAPSLVSLSSLSCRLSCKYWLAATKVGVGSGRRRRRRRRKGCGGGDEEGRKKTSRKLLQSERRKQKMCTADAAERSKTPVVCVCVCVCTSSSVLLLLLCPSFFQRNNKKKRAAEQGFEMWTRPIGAIHPRLWDRSGLVLISEPIISACERISLLHNAHDRHDDEIDFIGKKLKFFKFKFEFFKKDRFIRIKMLLRLIVIVQLLEIGGLTESTPPPPPLPPLEPALTTQSGNNEELSHSKMLLLLLLSSSSSCCWNCRPVDGGGDDDRSGCQESRFFCRWILRRQRSVQRRSAAHRVQRHEPALRMRSCISDRRRCYHLRSAWVLFPPPPPPSCTFCIYRVSRSLPSLAPGRPSFSRSLSFLYKSPSRGFVTGAVACVSCICDSMQHMSSSRADENVQ